VLLERGRTKRAERCRRLVEWKCKDRIYKGWSRNLLTRWTRGWKHR